MLVIELSKPFTIGRGAMCDYQTVREAYSTCLQSGADADSRLDLQLRLATAASSLFVPPSLGPQTRADFLAAH